MKLLRYGPVGFERPGILDRAGVIRDLSAIVLDIDADALSPEGLELIASIDPETLPAVRGPVRIGPCVASPSKFVAIGLNYSDHAKETGATPPTEPIVFLKATSCIVGPNDDVMLVPEPCELDWEVELGIVIGLRARHVPEDEVFAHVAGYCLVNDVSERYAQAKRGGTWDKGKGGDTHGPIGPWVVTRDEIADVQNLDMFLDVNGKRCQTGNTKTMIFDVKTIVSYTSRFMTLLPGDVICTGTPPGVGLGMKPPMFLKAGDEMRLGIAGLGEQRQKVVPFKR
jgi:2-keto-4-pentenoate hydratase/2-oxohepta-3-ene-1,7-dioic acid hydratase in catechol pathway